MSLPTNCHCSMCRGETHPANLAPPLSGGLATDLDIEIVRRDIEDIQHMPRFERIEYRLDHLNDNIQQLSDLIRELSRAPKIPTFDDVNLVEYRPTE